MRPEQFAEVISNCRAQAGLLAESLNQCFDTKYELEFGLEMPLESAQVQLDMPGLLVGIAVGSGAFLLALPAELLPPWHKAPNASQASRLATLAMEWSLNCPPLDMEAGESTTRKSGVLWQTIQDCSPLPEALGVPCAVSGGHHQIWLIGPVNSIPSEQAAPPVEAETAARGPRSYPSPPPSARPAAPDEPRVNRILKLPVTLIVQLANKRIELGQLQSLSPGALVTFDKSCEELLELYVNNSLYCRGEAVKVGEKFGLKVNEVSSPQRRLQSLIGKS